MIRALPLIAVLILFFCGQALLQQRVTRAYHLLPEPESATVLPLQFLQVVSLEYRNFVADMFFLKALNRFGETLERSEHNIVGEHVDDWEWAAMMAEIDLSTSLDPYFLDPYYFANAIITHNQKLIPRVSLLLESGAKKRDWDWELPFYAGFNYFFYLNQPVKASELLMEAARRPTNKSSLLSTLAARLAYQGEKTKNAIIFLKQMLASATDESVKDIYETRLQSLEGIYIIERAAEIYRERFQERPKAVTQLVTMGILKKLPIDPYGGKYFFDKNCKVKTTSNFRPVD